MPPELLVLAPDGTWSAAAAWGEACWYLVADPQAERHPDLAAVLHRFGADRPDVDVVYGDEAAAAAGFDGTRLIAQDYIGSPLAVRGRAMAALGGLDASAGSAQVYEMVLRASDAGLAIDRIAQVLAVNPAGMRGAAVADRMAVLRRAFARSRPECDVVPGLEAGTLELQRRFDDPPHVTVAIVPGRGPDPAADGLLRSIARTRWPMDRLHVVEGGPGVAQANQLWRACETELLVFLDEGSLVHEPGWLSALMTFAVDEDVGGVGVRPQDRYAPGGLPAEARVHRECAMVSGAAFATKRSVLEQVNGLDGRFGFENAVADLCLRLRLLGMRIVCTPHAGFPDRDGTPPEPDETALFLQKWQHSLARDPASPSDADGWGQRPNNRLNSPVCGGEEDADAFGAVQVE